MKFATRSMMGAALLASASGTALAQSAPATAEPPAAAPVYYKADGSTTSDYEAALASWRTDPQFSVDYSKGFMGLEHAYARGLTGRGVTIGINDGGVHTSHPLFQPAGKFIGLHTVVSGEYGNDGGIAPRRPWGDHGTHVAGTAAGARIAGERMFGNAFGATIFSGTINFAAGDFLWFRDEAILDETVFTARENILDLANSGTVRVINNSWGSNTTVRFDAPIATVRSTLGGEATDVFRPILDNDVLVVFSAGNGSGVHAGVDAAVPLWNESLRGNWLSIANYASLTAPSSSTSFCGQTATWCVAGPGHQIISAVNSGSFDLNAVRARFTAAAYPTLWSAGTVSALTSAASSRYVAALNNYLTTKRAAQAAGRPFDEDAARRELARVAVEITLVAGARLGTPDGTTSTLGGLLTSTNNMALLTRETSRAVLELANAELLRLLPEFFTITGLGYGPKTGTSMAAPNVSGFAALLMENFPEYGAALISDILVSSSTDIETPGVDLKAGWGVPQMQTALDGPTALRAVRDVTVGVGTVDVWRHDIGDARDRYSPEVLAGFPDDIGGIVKKGGGELILTGNSGYSGMTRVEGGLLTVQGSLLRSHATVADVGIIGGTGRLFTLTADSGGVVSPGTAGNPFGALTVGGDATFKPGSYLWVRSSVNALANSRLIVEGRTALEGGQVLLKADRGEWNLRSRLTFLQSAGGVNGVFDGVLSDLGFLTPTLSYTPNAVSLTLMRNDVSFASVGETPNQRATGSGLDRMPARGALYDALVDGSVVGVRAALDSLSGETHASLAAVAVNDSFHIRNAMLRRMPHSLLAGGRAGQATEGRGSSGAAVWGQGIVGFAEHEGSTGIAAVKSETKGFMTGLDQNWGGKFQLGVAGGYLDSDVNVHRPGSSSNRVRSWHVGGYLGAEAGPARLRGGGSWGSYQLTSGRTAHVNMFRDSLHGRYKGEGWQAFGEFGLAFQGGGAVFEPYANVTHVDFESASFAETGGGAALSGKTRQKVTASTLGLRTGAKMVDALGNTRAVGRVDIGWRRDLDNDGALASLAFAGGSAFVVQGAIPDRDSVMIDSGVDIAISPVVDLGFAYNGQYASRYQAHAAKVTLQWRF